MSYRWSNKEKGMRELRRPQYVEDDDRPAIHKSKKNTRKWCRGKPGLVHQWAWGIDARFTGYPWASHESRHYINKCTACGKHNVSHYGFYIICIESERDRKWCLARMAGKWAWWG